MDFLALVLKAAEPKDNLYLENYLEKGVINFIKTADGEANDLFFPETKRVKIDTQAAVSCGAYAKAYILYVISDIPGRADLTDLIIDKSYGPAQRVLKTRGAKLGRAIYGNYLEEFFTSPPFFEEEKYFNDLRDRLITTEYEAITKSVSALHSPAPAQLVLEGLRILRPFIYTEVDIAWGRAPFFFETFPDRDIKLLLNNYPWLVRFENDVLSGSLKDGITNAANNKTAAVKDWVMKNKSYAI